MRFKCFVCKQEIRSDALTFKAYASPELINKIEEKTVQKWYQDDGVCLECQLRLTKV